MNNYVACSRCGKQCSNETSQEMIVRAWIECPECIEKEKSIEMRLSAKTTNSGEVHFYLDDYNDTWPEWEDIAEHFWNELKLPLEDKEYWIEIKVVNK